MFHFTAYIIAPEDSVYRHKLVKLQFEIPPTYPLVPPKVKFVQHTGERIHPNLYVEGKVCLSILGTWPGEPWAFGMRCNSVLITIRSLLDNQPYCHEPNQRDNPAFNDYVRYATWRWLLLDYLDRETNPAARRWLRRYVRRHGSEMLAELRRQARAAEGGGGAAAAAVGAGGARTTSTTTTTTTGVGAGAPPGVVSHDRYLRSPYKRLQPLLPNYADVIEKLDKLWISTLTEVGLDGDSTDTGTGSGKRKMDDTVEQQQEGNQVVGDPKQQTTEEQSKGSGPLAAVPTPASTGQQSPKKKAKTEHEAIDLT